MNIRPETPRDYAAIADLHVRAFGGRVAEALIVTMLRHRLAFDPDLSLVAEIHGRIVGHALFSPQVIRLLGQDVRAVNLAPIGVDPNQQKQGVGRALILAGHRIACEKGYALSFLLGHTSYYPRFGYKTGVYGVSSDVVRAGSLPVNASAEMLEKRAPVEGDISALCELWRLEEYGVDFAIFPGTSLLDWVSPNPRIRATVYCREGRIVGYTRILDTDTSNPRLFMAYDTAAAWGMVADLMQDQTSLRLPLHPYSQSASISDDRAAKAWDAGMACSLVKDSPFEGYYERLQSGKRLPGRVIWPVAFDLE